jgi:hypothetical protein
MIKPNTKSIDILPNSNFVLETISYPLKCPFKEVKLKFFYLM